VGLATCRLVNERAGSDTEVPTKYLERATIVSI
jgi:hypothetical protein